MTENILGKIMGWLFQIQLICLVTYFAAPYGHAFQDSQGDVEVEEVGFDVADSDRSGGVSASEMRAYLLKCLEDEELRHEEIFELIDIDKDGQIAPAEFDDRHDAVEQVMGPGYLERDLPDPGKSFVLWEGSCDSTNDSKIMAATIYRFEDLLKDPPAGWPKRIDISKVPTSIAKALPKRKHEAQPPKTEDLVKSTVILCGGDGMGFFTSGGVLISKSGLVLTNYHVAEFLSEGRMAAMTTDGKCRPVIEFIAGNQDRDVALIRIEGSGFKHVDIATEPVPVGGNLEMIHHSENRFFTYDRGYVMRYPTLGRWPWMEISADYAPGASGCGIYNEKRQLVGLVSIIQYGDGPSLAEDLDMKAEDIEGGDEGAGEMQSFDTMLLVKHAVPLPAIQGLWKLSQGSQMKKRTTQTRKVVRELDLEDTN